MFNDVIYQNIILTLTGYICISWCDINRVILTWNMKSPDDTPQREYLHTHSIRITHCVTEIAYIYYAQYIYAMYIYILYIYIYIYIYIYNTVYPNYLGGTLDSLFRYKQHIQNTKIKPTDEISNLRVGSKYKYYHSVSFSIELLYE